MITMRSRWLFLWMVFPGATLCSTASAQPAPPQQSVNAASTTTLQNAAPANAANSANASKPPVVVLPPGAKKPESPSRALVAPAIVAGVGITGFLVSGIIYEYAGGLIAEVHTCNGTTCPGDKARLARAREYRSGTVGGMVASGLVFGVGLIWFAIVAPNANSYTPPRAYVVPVITPSGVFLTGAF